jgi:ribose 5-phosphate isomerase A
LDSRDELKRLAGARAAEMIDDGMVVGLGTGSTVNHLLDAIAARRAAGELGRIVGIPTSEETRRRSEALGIPLTDFARHPTLDLALDGTDEFDPELNLIKGLGGALLREKLVASASRRFVVLADDSKRVERLGTRSPLPVEVDPFGAPLVDHFLRSLGCAPRLRLAPSGEMLTTDGGHVIFDCHFEAGIEDPHELALRLDRQPGVFEHGLFLRMTERVVLAAAGGVEIVQPLTPVSRP